MKKDLKRIMSLFLCVLMIFSLVPVNVFAQSSEEPVIIETTEQETIDDTITESNEFEVSDDEQIEESGQVEDQVETEDNEELLSDKVIDEQESEELEEVNSEEQSEEEILIEDIEVLAGEPMVLALSDVTQKTFPSDVGVPTKTSLIPLNKSTLTNLSLGTNVKTFDHSNGDREICVYLANAKTNNKTVSYSNIATLTFENVGELGGRMFDVQLTISKVVIHPQCYSHAWAKNDNYVGIFLIRPNEIKLGLGESESHVYTGEMEIETSFKIIYHDNKSVINYPFYLGVSDLDSLNHNNNGYDEGFAPSSGFDIIYKWPNTYLTTKDGYFVNSTGIHTDGDDSWIRTGLIATTTNGQFSSAWQEGDCSTVISLFSQYINIPDPILSVNKTTVEPGDELIYTVSQEVGFLYRNTYTKYNDTSIQTVMPNGLTYKSAKVYDGNNSDITSIGTLSYNASTKEVKYSFDKNQLSQDNFYNAQTIKMEITATVDKTSPKNIRNDAESNIDGNTYGSNQVSINVLNADMSLNMSVEKQKYNVGDSAKYTITANQTTSGLSAKNVTITNKFNPNKVEISNIKVSQNGTDITAEITNNTDSFEITIDKIEYNKPITVTYNAKILEDESLLGTNIGSTATITATNFYDDTGEQKTIQTSKEIAVLDPTLELTLTSNKDSYYVGDEINYTLTVKQSTQDAVAKNVKIENVLDDTVKLDETSINIVGSDSQCTKENNSFIVLLDELSYGKTITITFNAEALTSDNSATDTATVSQSIKSEKKTLSKVVSIQKIDPPYDKPDLEAIYGDTLDDVDLPDGFEWVDKSEDVGNVGRNKFKARFIPKDQNKYNTLEIELEVNVLKATPIVSATASDLNYGQTLENSILNGTAKHKSKNVAGKFNWKNTTIIPTVNNDGFDVIFTPEDDLNYNSVELVVSVKVNPKPLYVINVKATDRNYEPGNKEVVITNGSLDNAEIIVRDGKKDEVILVDSAVKGMMNDDQSGMNKDVHVTGYEIEGKDIDNYILIQPTNIKVNILKAIPNIQNVKATQITYGDKLKESQITGESDVTGSFAWKNSEEIYIVGNDAHDVIFTPEDEANYERVDLSATVEVVPKVIKVINIKAIDRDYEPSIINVEIINGQINDSEIVVRNGVKDKIVLLDENVIGSMIDDAAGINKNVLASGYELDGPDAFNYTLEQPDRTTVNINKATVNDFEVFATEINYGQTLENSTPSGNAKIEGTYTWKNKDIIPTVQNDGFIVVFTPLDIENYNVVEKVAQVKVNPKPLYVINTKAIDRDYEPNNIEVNIVDGSIDDNEIVIRDGIKDDITLVDVLVKSEMDDPNVGENKPVHVTGYEIIGEDVNNYILMQPEDVTVNITKATPTVSATASSIIYGDTLDESDINGTSDVEGEFNWKNKDEIPTVGNDEHEVIFTPEDEDNYEKVEVKAVVEVLPKRLKVINIKAIDRNYEPKNIEVDIVDGEINDAEIVIRDGIKDDVVLVDEHVVGTMEDDVVGIDKDVTINGYELDGNDAYNYILEQPDNTTVNIDKAILKDIEVEATELNYGQELKESLLNGEVKYLDEVVEGEFTWVDNLIPVVNNNGFDVLFTPKDDINYESAQLIVKVKVNPKPIKVINIKAIDRDYEPENIIVDIIDGMINQEEIVIRDGIVDDIVLIDLNVVGTIEDANAGENKDVVVKGYELDGEDIDNYILIQPDNTTVNINKIDPEYEKPELSATYHETLKDVELPEGFEWVDDSQSVGDVGINSFDAIYTPEDQTNYNTLEIELDVKVGKAIPEIIKEPKAKENLVANGKKQDLVENGEVEGGKIVFSLEKDGEYTDEIPQGLKDGTYTVYWKVKGDNNHFDTESQSLTVIIKKQPTVNEPPKTGDNNFAIYSSSFIVSLIVLAYIIKKRIRKA